MNRKWRFVLKPQFDDAYAFSEGYATVRNGKKRGFLELGDDGKIRVYVAPKFENVYRFSEGLAPVKIGGAWGYLAARHQPNKQRIRAIEDLSPED